MDLKFLTYFSWLSSNCKFFRRISSKWKFPSGNFFCGDIFATRNFAGCGASPRLPSSAIPAINMTKGPRKVKLVIVVNNKKEWVSIYVQFLQHGIFFLLLVKFITVLCYCFCSILSREVLCEIYSIRKFQSVYGFFYVVWLIFFTNKYPVNLNSAFYFFNSEIISGLFIIVPLWLLILFIVYFLTFIDLCLFQITFFSRNVLMKDFNKL